MRQKLQAHAISAPKAIESLQRIKAGEIEVGGVSTRVVSKKPPG